MSWFWICGAVADASDGKGRHRVGAATALRLRTVGGGVPRVARGLATAGRWAGIPWGFAEAGSRQCHPPAPGSFGRTSRRWRLPGVRGISFCL